MNDHEAAASVASGEAKAKKKQTSAVKGESKNPQSAQSVIGAVKKARRKATETWTAHGPWKSFMRRFEATFTILLNFAPICHAGVLQWDVPSAAKAPSPMPLAEAKSETRRPIVFLDLGPWTL